MKKRRWCHRWAFQRIWFRPGRAALCLDPYNETKEAREEWRKAGDIVLVPWPLVFFLRRGGRVLG